MLNRWIDLNDFSSVQLDDAECELNCRPVNRKYFAKLREYAVDGTSCNSTDGPTRNSSKAVCVEGKCKVT